MKILTVVRNRCTTGFFTNIEYNTGFQSVHFVLFSSRRFAKHLVPEEVKVSSETSQSKVCQEKFKVRLL